MKRKINRLPKLKINRTLAFGIPLSLLYILSRTLKVVADRNIKGGRSVEETFWIIVGLFLLILIFVLPCIILPILLHRPHHKPLAVIFRSFSRHESFAVHAVLAKKLRKYGSVFAVERPEDRFKKISIDDPLLLMASPDSWQEEVATFIPTIKYAIVDVSEYTPGLRWELEQVKSQLDVGKVVLIHAGTTALDASMQRDNEASPYGHIARYIGLDDAEFFAAIETFFAQQNFKISIRSRLTWWSDALLDVLFVRFWIASAFFFGHRFVFKKYLPVKKRSLRVRLLRFLKRWAFIVETWVGLEVPLLWRIHLGDEESVWDDFSYGASVRDIFIHSNLYISLIMLLSICLAALFFVTGFSIGLSFHLSLAISYLCGVILFALPIMLIDWLLSRKHPMTTLHPIKHLTRSPPGNLAQRIFAYFLIPLSNLWLYFLVIPPFPIVLLWHWIDMLRINYPLSPKKKLFNMTIGLLWYPITFVNYLNNRKLWLMVGAQGFRH